MPVQAELATAQALFDRATDEKKAGTIAGIDVLRAEVELRTEQQRLLAQKNQVEKDNWGWRAPSVCPRASGSV